MVGKRNCLLQSLPPYNDELCLYPWRRLGKVSPSVRNHSIWKLSPASRKEQTVVMREERRNFTSAVSLSVFHITDSEVRDKSDSDVVHRVSWG